jgi:hypothetical protein
MTVCVTPHPTACRISDGMLAHLPTSFLAVSALDRRQIHMKPCAAAPTRHIFINIFIKITGAHHER